MYRYLPAIDGISCVWNGIYQYLALLASNHRVTNP